MGHRAEAEQALGYMLEGTWSWPITLTDPNGLSNPMTGTSTDIGQVIDPDTGETVSGRSASVVLRISSIFTAGFATIPVGISDSTSKPWVVTFDDIGGTSHTFKVRQTEPDRAAGVVVCLLELYTL